MGVTIVDCGIGNIKSVQRMFEAVDVDAELATEPAELARAERLVLPGVGAFDAGVEALQAGGWIEPLNELVLHRGTLVLGICLGMQLLCRRSEEGSCSGLGWIAADVIRIDLAGASELKLPHMGWAEIEVVRQNPLIPRGGEPQRFYHVHKYRAQCDDPNDVIATTTYGSEFTTVIGRGNIYGVQFHPEKSHRFGMELMRRFAEIQCPATA